MLICVIGYASLAIAGCNNAPATPNSPVIFNVTFLQNQWSRNSIPQLQSKLNSVSQKMASVTSAPYDVPIPNQINVYENHLMPIYEPQSITDTPTQEFWWSKLCGDHYATRVGVPHRLMRFDKGDWVAGWGYAFRCDNDYKYGIMLPGNHPNNWQDWQFFHELGHTVGLNHMTVQRENIMVGPGVNNEPPCHDMGWAMDWVQRYYVENETCFTRYPGLPPGATYPHPDNPIYGIPTPVPWCP